MPMREYGGQPPALPSKTQTAEVSYDPENPAHVELSKYLDVLLDEALESDRTDDHGQSCFKKIREGYFKGIVGSLDFLQKAQELGVPVLPNAFASLAAYDQRGFMAVHAVAKNTAIDILNQKVPMLVELRESEYEELQFMAETAARRAAEKEGHPYLEKKEIPEYQSLPIGINIATQASMIMNNFLWNMPRNKWKGRYIPSGSIVAILVDVYESKKRYIGITKEGMYRLILKEDGTESQPQIGARFLRELLEENIAASKAQSARSFSDSPMQTRLF